VGTVLYLNKPTQKQEEKGSVRRKRGSKKLYVDFYYFQIRIVKSTGLDDTPQNYTKAREWLDRNLEKIANGTFLFAQAFPGASQQEKEFFAQKEGWNYSPEPRQILFDEYVEKWMKEIWSNFHSEGKRRDFKQAINYWLLPYFKGKTFHQISGVELKKFLAGLKWQDGKNKGQLLSRSRVGNIMIPLRAIWNDACEEHRWQLPDPFRFSARNLPKASKKHPEVFRFEEWMQLLENIDPYYRNVTEIMVMTGLIGSEIAGLRRQDFEGDYIHVQNSIVRGYEKEDLKTEFRQRKLPITKALRERLDVALSFSKGDHFVSMKNGRTFDVDSFRKSLWTSALDRAGIPYKVPYATRHTFAAWALTVGLSPNKLVRLMGHGSKKMVYEVYGNYVEGLEKDAGQILEYFGNDFIGLKD
jgi:integrase